MGHVALHHEAQGLQRGALVRFGDVEAHEALRPRGVQTIGAGMVGGGPGLDHMAGLSAAKIEDQPRRQFQPRLGEPRVHAAFETIARVRVDLQRPARRRDADGAKLQSLKRQDIRLLKRQRWTC